MINDYSLLEKYFINNKNDNKVFSLTTLRLILLILKDITKNDTKKEIEAIVGNNEIIKSVIDNEYKMEIINSLWLNNLFSFDDNEVKRLSDKYSMVIFVDQFDSSINGKLNKYIKEKSHNLLDVKFDVDNNEAFVINSLMYLKAPFFSKLECRKEYYGFKNKNGDIVGVKLIESKPVYEKINERENYYSIRITSSNTKLYFILPKADTLDGILNSDTIKDVLEFDYSKSAYKSNVLFPRLELEEDIDLKSYLTCLGIKKLFTSDSDYTISNERLILSKIKQSNKIIIDENGILGSSLSSASIAFMSLEFYDLKTLVLNKPFIYIVEDNNKNILFTGIVNTLEGKSKGFKVLPSLIEVSNCC